MLPWEVKLREPKRILRDLARELRIPEFVVTRPKSGFGWEPHRWAPHGAALQPLVALASSEIEPELLSQLQSRGSDTAILLLNTINYAIWKRLCIQREPLQSLIDQLDCQAPGSRN
jgi:hypothetical protein